MASQVTNYKCPNCTGGLKFDGKNNNLKCEYCDSTFSVAEIEVMYADEDEAAAKETAKKAEKKAKGDGWDDSELENWGLDEGMKAYSCPSCGAELICAETTSATACPYCGNPTIIPGQFVGGLKPDYVIPFKIDQAEARSILGNFYKKKKFLPDVFSTENKLKEIKAIYVPFWLYDGEASGSADFRGTKVRSYRSGDYRITETSYFDVERAGHVRFEKIPVDASSKMPNEYMDALEPYDYNEMTKFSTAYLPGFMADRYDEDAKMCAERADGRARNTILSILKDDVMGYTTLKEIGSEVTLRRGKVHYALLPVYTLVTKWNDETYLFTVNGQTGKIAGNLPIDKSKYRKWLWGITAGVTLVLGSGILAGLLT